jgi:hypothetical protein
LVQVGFEPKLAFICPLCNKEVEILYERGKGSWISDHAGCLNFSVIRNVPMAMEVGREGPLVFIALESDFSVKEAIEGLRALSKEEGEQSKRQKLETGIKRLESRLGFAEKNLSRTMEALKSGAFGLKVISGREICAVAWKSGERYFGVAETEDRPLKEAEAVLATNSPEEAQRFVLHWLHYWEQGRIIP